MDIHAQIDFIGGLLVSKGVLTAVEVHALKEEVEQNPVLDDFEELIIERGLITEEALLEIYSDYLSMPVMDIRKEAITPQIVSLIPAKFANTHGVLAVKRDQDHLTIATRHPFDVHVMDELKTFTGLSIIPVLCPQADIQRAINQYYGTGAETVEKLVREHQGRGQTGEHKLPFGLDPAQEGVDDGSMVDYVNQLLLEGFRERATDIHIEPFKNRLRVRYRIDGVLVEAKTPQHLKKIQDAILSRLKVMANLNISEKRRPQDGRCKLMVDGRDIDLRVSTFPTLFGEGMCIRLLSAGAVLLELKQLGLADKDFETISTLLKKPNGILLVTGPTGCGKTTTLYSCINQINQANVNIVTLEDPIEYQIDGVNQIQVNPKADLTFASGFRSVLRQDPDIIFVGEVRDGETAQIAIRAALTGHLIFSTLHTNNALASVARLLDLGIEPYLITNTLKAVIAQRLVRRICSKCKESYRPGEDVAWLVKQLEQQQKDKVEFFRGKGCAHCNQTGYRGRIALFELLTIDENLNKIILTGDPHGQLNKQAEVAGMSTLQQDGLRKVSEGLTTLEEVVRVTG